MLALLDPDADLTERLLGSGLGMVHLLQWTDRGLADVFAGVAPAPGGAWRLADWIDTEHGPRLSHAATWAALSVEAEVEVGWSRLVTCVVDQVHVGDDDGAMIHRRGRYQRV